MRKKIHNILFVFFLILSQFYPLSYVFPQDLQTKSPKPPQKWGYVYSNSFEKFPQSYVNRILKDYDVICITGLLLRGTGQLRFENEFINKITQAGIRKNPDKPIIYPMIGLSSVKDGISLLNSDNSRKKSIDNIIKFLTAYNFKGVHIDFEGLPEDYARAFSLYLKDLKTELQQVNLILSMAIFPQLEFKDTNKGFHNPSFLSQSVDMIVIMMYDYHNTKTEQGCTTGELWAENNIVEIQKNFSSEKIWLGIPAYGYEWSNALKTPRVVSAREAHILKNQNPFTRDPNGCIKITVKEGGRESIIFYSDEQLRSNLNKLAEKYSLSGTALWRLGLEED